MPITINNTVPLVRYTASASQTVFPYTFDIFADADLVVVVDGVLQVLTTNYTVSGANGSGGGNVTFVSGLTVDASVVIYSDIALQREIEYQPNGALRADTINEDINRVVRMIQQTAALGEGSTTTVRFDASTAGLPLNALTGSVADRAGKVISFDSEGQAETTFSLVDNTQNKTDAAASATASASSATASASSATASASSASASATSAAAAAAIQLGNIADNSITEPLLDISNAPTDGKILEYKNGTDKMTWVDKPAALTAGTNITITGGAISSTDNDTTYSVGDGGLTQKNFTTALNTKLENLEITVGATFSILDVSGTFTASGNFITVTGIGAGGGGGGGSFNGSGGDGGDAAFMDGAIIPVTAGETYTVVVGTGGNGGGGVAGQTADDGTDGGDTTIISSNSVTLVSLGGGGSGQGANNSGAGNDGADGTVTGNATGSATTRSSGTSTGLAKPTLPGVGLGSNGGASQGQQSGSAGSNGSIYILY